MTATEADARRRLYLRASIKLLAGIGFLFLLVPFVGSLPWPRATLPADATVIEATAFPEGTTRLVTLADGSTAYVTRNSAALRRQLEATPADRLWYPSAPGLATQAWFVLQPLSATDEPVRFLPADGDWPGGFIAPSGAAWDLAGRALKPWPGHPGGLNRTVQNLVPMPHRADRGRLVLRPARSPR